MSFEGYFQCLCEVGHLFVEDAYHEVVGCPYCKRKVVYHNLVDQTNGEEHLTYKEFEVLVPAKVETCSKCHTRKVISEAIYKIPGVEDQEVPTQEVVEKDPAKEFVKELKELLGRYKGTLSCDADGYISLEMDGVEVHSEVGYIK